MNVRELWIFSIASIVPSLALAQDAPMEEAVEEAPPEATEMQADAPAAATGDAERPAGMAMGVGLGWTEGSGASVAPDTAAGRLRLEGGLTLEPSVGFHREKTTADNDDIVSDTRLVLAAQARKPIASKGAVDFLGIGVVSIERETNLEDPDGSDNNLTTTVQTIGLHWGIGAEWFVKSNLSIGFDITNPLFVTTSTKFDPETGDGAETSTQTIALIFDPLDKATGRAMITLYQ